MKTVKMEQFEMDFMVELQALLDKYNARMSTTTKGYGDNESRHLNFTFYDGIPIVGQVNKLKSNFAIYSNVIQCHDEPVKTKLK